MAALATLAAWVVCIPANAQSALIPYALQSDPAIPDITTKQQQEEVMSLFTAHVGLWLTRDPDRYPYERLITEDALFEYPYADTESARQIQGRKAVAEILRALPRAAARATSRQPLCAPGSVGMIRCPRTGTRIAHPQ